MKYISYRIDTSTIIGDKAVNGFFVSGQKSTDYNWSFIHESGSMGDAKDFIKSIITDPIRQIVYGPDGYGISL